MLRHAYRLRFRDQILLAASIPAVALLVSVGSIWPLQNAFAAAQGSLTQTLAVLCVVNVAAVLGALLCSVAVAVTVRKSFIARLNGLVKVAESYSTVAGSHFSASAKSVTAELEKDPWFNRDEIGVLTHAFLRTTAEIRQREAESAALLGRFERALENAQVGLWELDVSADSLSFDCHNSESLRTIAPQQSYSLQETNWPLHPDNRAEFLARVQTFLTGDVPNLEFENWVRTVNDGFCRVQGVGRATKWDAEGRPMHALGTFRIVTESRSVKDQLRSLNHQLMAQTAVAELAGESGENLVTSIEQGALYRRN